MRVAATVDVRADLKGQSMVYGSSIWVPHYGGMIDEFEK